MEGLGQRDSTECMDLPCPGCNTTQGGCSDADVCSGDASFQCGDPWVGVVGEVPSPTPLTGALVGGGGV